jgi:hypothetical protein
VGKKLGLVLDELSARRQKILGWRLLPEVNACQPNLVPTYVGQVLTTGATVNHMQAEARYLLKAVRYLA